MKKFLMFMLCLMLLFVTPVMAFASEVESSEVEAEVEAGAEAGAEAEVEVEQTMTDTIVAYVQDNFEEISVIGTMILAAFYNYVTRGKLQGSIGTLNNNAVNIAQNSADTIKTALAGVKEIAEVVYKYKDEMESLIGEIRKSAEEKKSLEETLSHVEGFLKTSKLATIELSNEVAELLVLANIPLSKKDELYARHRAAVDAIAVVEAEAEATGEVTNHDGEEA